VPETFVLAPDLATVVRPAVLWWAGATVLERDVRLDAGIADAAARTVEAPPEDVQAVRAMYRRVGIDPTRTRPSNEALLRRVRRGDAFPRVNGLVDIVNWCSLEFQLPYGVYDRARIRGPVTLRLGAEGESYAGIRKDAVNVAARLTLADDDGPFGNPTSDSARTMVTPATTAALVVIYAPVQTRAADLARVAAATAARLATFVGGREIGRHVG
jgi:DNA/RNA-binding domain of Phe-tRNA-synthetase-like protein